MTASSYECCLARLLAHEGGYTNDAADPGGPTNFGITIYDYRKYVNPGATAADVRAMKADEAKAIYRSKYWDAQRCDELPAGVDYAVFDYGVNSGIGRSGKVLRRVLGLPDKDWRIGDDVLAALGKRDAKQIVAAICDERLRFLQSLRTWNVFGKGWGARVVEVKAYALKLASGAASASAPVVKSAGKGTVPVARGAQQGSTAAVIAAGAAAAQQVHQSGAGTGAVVLIVVLALVAALAAYAFWHWWQTIQQNKPA